MADEQTRAGLLAHLDALRDDATATFGPDSAKPYPDKLEQFLSHLGTCRMIVDDLHDLEPWVQPPDSISEAEEANAALRAELAEAKAALAAAQTPTVEG